MEKKSILEFYQLSNMLAKMSEEELKSPQGQIFQDKCCALEAEYMEWMDTVNSPEKLADHNKKMKIDESLGILATALNSYLASPLPKPVDNEVYQEAFNVLVETVKNSNLEKSKED